MAKTPKQPVPDDDEPEAGATSNPDPNTAAGNPDEPEGAAPVKVETVAIHRQRIGFMGWKPDKPDIRDHKLGAGTPRANPPNAFLDGDLLPPIRDQGNQGSCTGHMTRSMVQFKRNTNAEPLQELSPRFAYYNGRLIEGTTDQDAGCEIRDVIKGVSKLGLCTERLCPYTDRGRGFMQRPTSAAYQEGLTDLVTAYQRVPRLKNDTFDLDLDALRASIVAGNPVGFGFTVYENFLDEQTAADGIMREPEGGTDGGHAVWVCGYDDAFDFEWTAGGALIGNSWGTEWGAKHPDTGERGYFWMPWALLQNWDFADDFWSVDMVKK